MPFTSISALDFLEFLDEANRDVACFCEGILLAETNTWAAVEWEVLPPRTKSLPALWLVLFSVGAIEVGTTVHDIWGVADCSALGNEERCLAVWATATGKDSIAYGVTRVTWDDGMGTKG